jgi:hypothetical protein
LHFVLNPVTREAVLCLTNKIAAALLQKPTIRRVAPVGLFGTASHQYVSDIVT